jgi:hypothetical protein
MTGGQSNVDGPFWPALRYQHIRPASRPVGRYSPVTVNKISEVAREPLGTAAWLLQRWLSRPADLLLAGIEQLRR